MICGRAAFWFQVASGAVTPWIFPTESQRLMPRPGQSSATHQEQGHLGQRAPEFSGSGDSVHCFSPLPQLGVSPRRLLPGSSTKGAPRLEAVRGPRTGHGHSACGYSGLWHVTCPELVPCTLEGTSCCRQSAARAALGDAECEDMPGLSAVSLTSKLGRTAGSPPETR